MENADLFVFREKKQIKKIFNLWTFINYNRFQNVIHTFYLIKYDLLVSGDN